MDLRTLDFSSLQGAIQFDAPLASLSWFRVGGPADLLFTPEDEDDLIAFLKLLPNSVPIFVIGLGSNLLVRDGGIRGAVVRLGRAFQTIALESDHHIRAGAQAADVKVARVAAEAGVKGFSFLRGIPGTIGGALRMNGGAYGGETKDIFVSARGIDRIVKAVCIALITHRWVFHIVIHQWRRTLFLRKLCSKVSLAIPQKFLMR